MLDIHLHTPAQEYMIAQPAWMEIMCTILFIVQLTFVARAGASGPVDCGLVRGDKPICCYVRVARADKRNVTLITCGSERDTRAARGPWI